MLKLGEGRLLVAIEGEEPFWLSERFACVDCGISLPPIEPRMFSFNGPHGACPACDGLGARTVIDPERPNPMEADYHARTAMRAGSTAKGRSRLSRDAAPASMRPAAVGNRTCSVPMAVRPTKPTVLRCRCSNRSAARSPGHRAMAGTASRAGDDSAFNANLHGHGPGIHVTLARGTDDRCLISQINGRWFTFTRFAADHQRCRASTHVDAGALNIGSRFSAGLGIASGCL